MYGANSTWDTNGQLYIGYGGSGDVAVSNGGTMLSGTSAMASTFGSHGSVIVDGLGSSWTASTLVVGQAGIASLSIVNGGMVASDIVSLGNGAGAIGFAAVDGSGSQLNAGTGNAIVLGPSLIVGAGGSGYLTVSNGGSINTNGYISIAKDAGSTGQLNIGSSPTDTSPLANPGTVNALNVGFGAGAGTINFNHASSNYAFDPEISGFGTINQLAGTTVLSADSSAFTGATNVVGGMLVVNGALGGTMDVGAAGRLQGIGTVGDTIVSGTIAPGNSIGTLHVTGDIIFNPGSIYEVEVNAAGQGDKIIASGKATINGGTVKVLAGAGNYAQQTHYTILTANGAAGVSGSFSGVTSNLAFLDPSLSYDANNVYLTMTRNNVNFTGVGQTVNQIATGGGVELGLGPAGL